MTQVTELTQLARAARLALPTLDDVCGYFSSPLFPGILDGNDAALPPLQSRVHSIEKIKFQRQQVELWLPSKIKRRWQLYLHCGITLFRNCASQPHKTFPKRMELSRQQRSFRKGFVRLIGANSETNKPPAGLLGLQTILMAAASAL